jgi:putative PIN family toxin of toxin-antitoxin system
MERPKFSAILARLGLSSAAILNDLQLLAELVTPVPLSMPVCRDPDDDAVLAVALSAQADLIVSGDADLLDLREYQGIPIVTAAEALRIIDQTSCPSW